MLSSAVLGGISYYFRLLQIDGIPYFPQRVKDLQCSPKFGRSMSVYESAPDWLH